MRAEGGLKRKYRFPRQASRVTWTVSRDLIGSPLRRIPLPPSPPKAAPRQTDGLRDISHPLGLGGWIAAPILMALLSLVAVTSSVATGLGRIAVWSIDTAVRGLGVFRRLGNLPAHAHQTFERLMTLHPESAPPARPSDHAFHGVKEAAAPAEPVMPTDQAMEIIQAALADTPETGDPSLPDDLPLLATLLGPRPAATDFRAADMVRDCFAPLGQDSRKSRALLAVALRLSREFGLPSRLPLATARAWHMLDPAVFENEMAAQLGAISDFISNWQKTQQTFLCLEFPEIELIEFLFESLSPLRHSDVMYDVLNFKALSNRRQGILRRIPHRLRKFVQDSAKAPTALLHVDATQIFLDRVAVSHGYAPIIQAATTSLEEVKKIAEKLLPPAATAAPPGGGQPLARITPVKRPASELADQAMAAAPPMPRPPVPAAPPPIPAAAQIAPRPTTAAPAAPPSVPVVTPRPVGTPAPATRRAMAPSKQFSSIAAPVKTLDGISSIGKRDALAVLGATPSPIIPGKRPPLPKLVMEPLPVLAHGVGTTTQSPPPKPAAPTGTVTGRIALPTPTPTPTPPPSAATGSAHGRIVIPPPRPAAPAVAPPAPVTDLTVVRTAKRPPITQAIKRQSVLKVLRGESATAIAAALGIRESKLDEWVDAFITAGAGALSPPPRKPSRTRKDKTAEPAPLSAEVLRAKLAEVLATAQLIERAMEAQLQPRRPVLLPPPENSSGQQHSSKHPRKKG